MNDDIVYFSYIELICIELYIMINMMVCNDDGLNNDHTIELKILRLCIFCNFRWYCIARIPYLYFLPG